MDDRTSRRHLAVALLAGMATHGLFRNVGVGLNFGIWTAALCAASVVLFGASPIPRRGWIAVASTVVIGFAPTLRASDWSLAWTLPTWSLAMALLPAMLGDEKWERVVFGPLRAIAASPGAIAATAKLRGLRVPPSTLGKGAIGVLLGAPFTLVFVTLLSFDQDFTAALALGYDRVGTAIWMMLSILAWTVTLGIAAAAYRRARNVPRGDAYAPVPYRLEGNPFAAATDGSWVSPLTWFLALGQVVLVLGIYVAVSARHGFAGHAAIRSAGETYANYLHAGVLQLLVVSALCVGLVLAGHFLLGRHRSFRTAALECSLLGLAAATLASCLLRTHVYEQAYGATLERLGVAAVAIGVALVLALTVVKSVRFGWRGYATTTAVSLALFGALLSLANADSLVAHVNLERARAGAPLDEAYLRSLSSDACAVRATSDLVDAWRADARRNHRTLRSWRGVQSCQP